MHRPAGIFVFVQHRINFINDWRLNFELARKLKCRARSRESLRHRKGACHYLLELLTAPDAVSKCAVAAQPRIARRRQIAETAQPRTRLGSRTAGHSQP